MRLVVIIGYFDVFSGYQEVGLVRALARENDVHVITSDQVNPIFTDEHLDRLGRPRRYQKLSEVHGGAKITRLPSRHLRAMAWNCQVGEALRRVGPDAVVQMMPGQLMPSLATWASGSRPRAVIFGDNRAMWAGMSPVFQKAKETIFSLTKGLLYRATVRGATAAFCYTPDTRDRLKKYFAGLPAHLLPLAFDEDVFWYDSNLRQVTRMELGVDDSVRLILLVGKYKREKRFEEVVAAFRELHKKDPQTKLMLVGPSPADLTHVLDLEDLSGGTVTLVPFADHQRLNALMNASDIGIWPAMPAITIQQAMGTGLFVVINDDNLVGHLISDKRVGTAVRGMAEFPPERLQEVLAQALCEEKCAVRSERTDLNRWLSAKGAARRVMELLRDPVGDGRPAA